MLSNLLWVVVGLLVAWYVPGVGAVKSIVDGLVAKVKGLINK